MDKIELGRVYQNITGTISVSPTKLQRVKNNGGNNNFFATLTQTSFSQLPAASTPRLSRSIPPTWCQSCSGSALKASIDSFNVMTKEDLFLATQNHGNLIKAKYSALVHNIKTRNKGVHKPSQLVCEIPEA